MSVTIERRVDTAAEAKALLRAAEVLGLSARVETSYEGWIEGDDPVWGRWPVKSMGPVYAQVEMNGAVFRARPPSTRGFVVIIKVQEGS